MTLQPYRQLRLEPELTGSITKPPLIQESRLAGGGPPNLVALVERKVPVERKMRAAHQLYSFAIEVWLAPMDWVPALVVGLVRLASNRPLSRMHKLLRRNNFPMWYQFINKHN